MCHVGCGCHPRALQSWPAMLQEKDRFSTKRPQQLLPWCCSRESSDESSEDSIRCIDEGDDLWKQSRAGKCESSSNPAVLAMLIKIDQTASSQQPLLHQRRPPQITNLLLPEEVDCGPTSSLQVSLIPGNRQLTQHVLLSPA